MQEAAGSSPASPTRKRPSFRTVFFFGRVARVLSFRHMLRTSKQVRSLLRDLSVLALSILFAVVVSQTDFVGRLFVGSEVSLLVTAFVAGALFSSAFTTAPAIVILGQLAQVNGLWEVAVVGAVGALLADLLIFKLFKDTVSGDLRFLAKKACGKACVHALRTRPARLLSVIMGGAIIASPLPDELGLALMGVTRIPLPVLIPVSYALNFLGIVLIGLVAKQLV